MFAGHLSLPTCPKPSVIADGPMGDGNLYIFAAGHLSNATFDRAACFSIFFLFFVLVAAGSDQTDLEKKASDCLHYRDNHLCVSRPKGTDL